MTHEQFTQIYLPLCGKMYALAYNFLHDCNKARDCVQDVYAELWESRDTIDSTMPILPSVLKMVSDKCIDRLSNALENAPKDCPADAPVVVVNVIVNEEHHYHKGATHIDNSMKIMVNNEQTHK